jgi:ribulose kinase
LDVFLGGKRSPVGNQEAHVVIAGANTPSDVPSCQKYLTQFMRERSGRQLL